MSQAPLYTLASPGTARGLMADLWQQSLQEYEISDSAYGLRITDDFKVPATSAGTSGEAVANWWMEDSAAGGTSEAFSSAAGPDGVRTLAATTGTDHFGAECHYGDAATTLGLVPTPLCSTTASRRGRVVFQARVDLGTTAVGAGPLDTYFIGLTEPIGTFLSSVSALPTDSDYIGFYRYDAGTLTFVVGNDNNGGTAVLDSINIPSGIIVDGYNNFGFAINPIGNGQVSYDVVLNNVWLGPLAKTLDTLACPIELLTPRFATTRGPTGDRATVAMPIDRVDVYVAPA